MAAVVVVDIFVLIVLVFVIIYLVDVSYADVIVIGKVVYLLLC